MAKINHEEYELLKGLDNQWKWIARDSGGNRVGNLFAYSEKPFKSYDMGEWAYGGGIYPINIHRFQFIQWESEEPHNIAELIEEYESEETEVKKDIEWVKRQVADREFNSDGGELHLDVIKTAHVYKILSQLDEPEVKNIALQDITHRLWELPSNNRKLWLARLNDEFQEGYIVPLGLKTTGGEEQYLTFNGSYFASRRNRGLQQTFATLEEIPEFYRDLAERVL